MENRLLKDHERMLELVWFAGGFVDKYELRMAFPNTKGLVSAPYGWVIEHPTFLRHPVDGEEACVVAMLHQSFLAKQVLNRSGFRPGSPSAANDRRRAPDLNAIARACALVKPWTKQNLCRLASMVRTNRFINADLMLVAKLVGSRPIPFQYTVAQIGDLLKLDEPTSRDLLWTAVFTGVVPINLSRQIDLDAIARTSINRYCVDNLLFLEDGL